MIISTVMMAGVGAYFLVFSKAATPDGCTDSNVKVFMSNDCVKVVKNLANIATSSGANDTNNPGFDGTLNQTLLNLNSVGLFNACGTYVPTSGVTPCVYNALKDFVDAKLNPPPAPVPTPAPPAPTAPADNPVACRDQGLKTNSSGDCVNLLNASMNVVINKCYAKQPLTGGRTFNNDTNSYIAWTVAAGNLGDEAKATGYNGTVTPRLWDIIMFSTAFYNGGNKCQGLAPAPVAPTPAPKTGTATTAPTSTPPKSPSGAGTAAPSAPPPPTVDCATQLLKKGMRNDCVKQLKYYLVVIAPSDTRETVKAQIKWEDNNFDDALNNYLYFTINTTSVIIDLPQGSYNGIVTDAIWNRIKLTALAVSKNDAKTYVTTFREGAKAVKEEEQRVAQAEKQRLETEFTNAVVNLMDGDPNYIRESLVGRTWQVSVDFEANGKNPVISADDGGITQGKTGYCVLIIYPALDGKSTWWTYGAYTNNQGACTARKSVRSGQGFKPKWTDTTAVTEKLTAQSISVIIPGSNASTRAVNGSFQETGK